MSKLNRNTLLNTPNLKKQQQQKDHYVEQTL
jgi:hypothetical protein